MSQISINHDGNKLNEILDISLVDMYKIMLDSTNEYHNKLILCYFLLADDRGAICISMIAIINNKLPESLAPSIVVEYIMKADTAIVNTLVTLFNIENFFTGDAPKKDIINTIMETEELKELRHLVKEAN